MKRWAPVLVAVLLSAGVLVSYAALGGGRYSPAPPADPCLARASGSGGGTSGTLERIVLATVDDAACKLGVSREELVLSLRDRQRFEQLAQTSGVGADAAARQISSSLAAAIGAAEQDGALSGFVAGIARGLTKRVPPWLLLGILEKIGGLVG